jgi:hypothetical protein
MLAALCHCRMCRRASAAPAVGWAMYREEQLRFLNETPARYASSAEATRSFCSRCGTQICFVADYLPGLVDITIGSLDDPQAVPATFHYWYDQHLSWLQFADTWPKHPEFPPGDT